MAAMTKTEIDAVVGGYHGDPFRVLGPHQIKLRGKPPCWQVRAWLPQAAEAMVVSGYHVTPMQRRHPDGFFVAPLESSPNHYRLRIRRYDGTEAEIEDPYRFPLLLSEFELHLHGEGTLYEAYNTLGAQLMSVDGVEGVRFAVWAPGAEVVSVVGTFNDWDTRRHPMRLREGGVWELFLPCAREGDTYKYYIRSKHVGHRESKTDPYA